MAQKNTMAASIQAKKGRLYAVIQHRKDGKTKPVWRSLGLAEDAGKAKITKAFREVVARYESEAVEAEARENCPANDILVFEYMCSWLEKAKKALQHNTYQSYHDQIHGRIKRHFEKRNDLTIGSLRAKDIEQFYESMFADGVSANTVIHYHAVLRRAFQQAFREELIDVNPFDRVERPKKNSFQGDSYSEEELIALLNLSRNDPIYPVIMLAGGLGVRRSEALGVRWSRIDWDSRCVLLDTKIIECKENGQLTLKAVEEMKNRSSKRTLPLPIPVFEMLLETKARQEFYRKIFKTSYSRAYEDYVCVNQLGELLKPSYVTAHFPILLEQLGLRKIRFHDLRHTFASIQLKNEVPLIRVSNFLGHSDTSTTAKIYAHLDRSSKQPSADIISELYQRGKERWQVGSKD